MAAGDRPKVLLLDPADTVAVALTALEPGTPLDFSPALGIRVEQRIPFGHKVAVAEMRAGDPVVKYGEVIGYATAAIRPGQHVHVQNVRSDRARAPDSGIRGV